MYEAAGPALCAPTALHTRTLWVHGDTQPKVQHIHQLEGNIMNLRPILASLTALGTVAFSAPVLADDFVCRTTVGTRTLDNVVVPSDATCRLEGTTVEGNVTVNRGATLVTAGAYIDGNVQAEGARRVVVSAGTQVGGSVQIKQGGAATVQGSTIDSDVQLDSNSGAVKALKNTVGGNMQIVQNSGGVTVKRNRIDGALQCKANHPAPVGGGNRASSKEDQCAAL